MLDWTTKLEDIVKRAAGKVIDRCNDASYEDFEDACQEARLRICQWSHVTRDLGQPPPPLAYTMAFRAACDWERSSRRHRVCSELPGAQTTDPFETEDCEAQSIPPSQEYEAILGSLLGQLVNDEREALVALLLVYEGLTMREVAEESGIPLSTVHSIVERMKTRMSDLGIALEVVDANGEAK